MKIGAPEVTDTWREYHQQQQHKNADEIGRILRLTRNHIKINTLCTHCANQMKERHGQAIVMA